MSGENRSGDDWEYQVRHRAYELWNAAGRPDGKHQQFWEEAERELKRLAAEEHRSAQDAPAPHPAGGPQRDPV